MLALSETSPIVIPESFVRATVNNNPVERAYERMLFKKVSKPVRTFWMIASTASMAVSTYHGYKRNQSIGWALVWGALGAAFPILTPTVAIAQGLGKEKPHGLGRTRYRRRSER
jgi:hypothetical protein